MFQSILNVPFHAVMANDVDALIPELWAQESLAILEENMVIALLVHRDFENQIANFGDVVNTRKPQDFAAKRKTNADNVTIQDAIATNVPVPLNQHIHTSFLLKDGEESLAFKDLVAEFLRPAMVAQARFVDQTLLGQYHRFIGQSTGQLGGLTSANAKDATIDVRRLLNEQLAPMDRRHKIWTPSGEAAMLGTDLFVSAEKVGDDGTALREASLGRKFGLDHWMSQNMADVGLTDENATAAINLAAGYPVGTTVMTIDTGSGAIADNSWVTIDGDDTPLRVVSTVGGATPTSITVASPGLRNAVLDDAVLTQYGVGTNEATVFAVGYAKEIGYAGFTIDPQVGQLVTFGTDPTSPVYTIVQVDTGAAEVVLDRPLEAALASGGDMYLGPNGQYNLALHRNALALVSRPLAMPRAGVGALASVINFNGLSMRATITYDGNAQGHLVTLDMLFGVALLDVALGALCLG
jgi:hypothetical protein